MVICKKNSNCENKPLSLYRLLGSQLILTNFNEKWRLWCEKPAGENIWSLIAFLANFNDLFICCRRVYWMVRSPSMVYGSPSVAPDYPYGIFRIFAAKKFVPVLFLMDIDDLRCSVFVTSVYSLN